MKKYLLLLWSPSTPKLKTSVSVSVAFRGFTGPATTVAGIVIPGTDIITTTDVFTIVPRIIRVTTTADTTAAIIDAIGELLNDFAITTSARAKNCPSLSSLPVKRLVRRRGS